MTDTASSVPRGARSIQFLVLGCWAVYSTQLALSFPIQHSYVALHLSGVFVALLGLLAGVLAVFQHSKWWLLTALAAAAFLLRYVGAVLSFAWWRLDRMPVWEALGLVFEDFWAVLVHFAAASAWGAALSYAFGQFLMPLVQVGLLILTACPLTSRSTGPAASKLAAGR